MRNVLLLSTVSFALAGAARPSQAALASNASNAHASTRETAIIADPGGPVPLADSIVVEKKARRLTLYHQGRALRSYRVALGANPVGDKRVAGDRRTPEGVFQIDWKNEKSDFHLALHISYPDSAHRARAEALGMSPGGDILIHGLRNGSGASGAFHRTADWTDGCIALTDQEIEGVWSAVMVGTPVEIKP
ncbi:MAG: L,D-transpeptidase family protein [Gemmatimonadaceae bacterium]